MNDSLFIHKKKFICDKGGPEILSHSTILSFFDYLPGNVAPQGSQAGPGTRPYLHKQLGAPVQLQPWALGTSLGTGAGRGGVSQDMGLLVDLA